MAKWAVRMQLIHVVEADDALQAMELAYADVTEALRAKLDPEMDVDVDDAGLVNDDGSVDDWVDLTDA